jgi:2-methylaconitate isomerase
VAEPSRRGPEGATQSVPVVIMRGGTSKGVFVPLTVLPAPGDTRDRLLLRLMGSPDPMQLDGLGGTHSSTSKVMAVGPAGAAGADVDYLFAQVAVDQAVVDYAGNCGNLTAGVAHYAVDEGLVPRCEPTTTLRMRNLNTGVVVRATVPVRDGRAQWQGDTVIDGVPGGGAPLLTEYLDPAGSVTGSLFPTGRRRDRLEGFAGFEVSLVDVSSPYLFVNAVDLGLRGEEAPADLNASPELLARLESLRRAGGRAIGVDSLALPRVAVVSPGRHLRVLATSMGKVHHAVPMTGALCIAAAAVLDGTVAAEVTSGPRPGSRRGPGSASEGSGFEPASEAGPASVPVGGEAEPLVVRIEHPKGAVEATVLLDGDRVAAAGGVRTARRLLSGTAFL